MIFSQMSSVACCYYKCMSSIMIRAHLFLFHLWFYGCGLVTAHPLHYKRETVHTTIWQCYIAKSVQKLLFKDKLVMQMEWGG